MEQFFFSLALITAGVSLITGLINLFAGWNKAGEKAELRFGLLGILIFIFLIFPPEGFIRVDKAPYPLAIIIKRSFIYLHYALMPWFFAAYSGYKNRLIFYGNIATLILAYVLMATTTVDSQKPLWIYVVLVPLGLILLYGALSVYYLLNQKKIREGRWLMAAMLVYAVLFSLAVINQVGDNYFGRLLNTKMFFPFHLNLLAFIAIMSIRIQTNSRDKHKLEKKLHRQDSRWRSIVDAMQLIVVELDKHGHIVFVNPYASKSLGCKSSDELLGRCWFDEFYKDEAASTKQMYKEAVDQEKPLLNRVSQLHTKDFRVINVKWTNVLLYGDDGSLSGTMNIGADITEQEKTIMQIRQLKNEIEKENLLLKGEVTEFAPGSADSGIIGQSDAITYVIQKARKVAKTHASVLLLGETGVGKELFAQLIHQNSYRRENNFVKINCAALPPELIESELFGHEKGSFTGAVVTRKGRFELANGGSIFLDEIGELLPSLQPKLLRVLQNGEFERVGGSETIKVNVRVIAATNRDLEQEVKQGNFREDLYYRLNVFPITVPPLRKRTEDIPLLVSHFAKTLAAYYQKDVLNVSKADLMRLKEYRWPGNVRELFNVIERSIILGTGDTLRLDGLLENGTAMHDLPSSLSMDEVERKHLVRVLEECRWKINGDDGAATRLGLHPSTLRSRLKKLQISREA